MSNLTSELNLSLAVDDDDTADYLTIALSDSLGTLDGMFNASTGHNHNGSHQGGVLQFLDFTVGEDLTVMGASDLHGSVHMRSNLTVDGAATMGTTLNVVGLTTTGTLDVLGTTLLRGAVTIQGGINAIGGLTITGPVNATGDIKGRYLHTTDGSNGIVYADNGNLYLRGALVVVDTGAGLNVSGYAQVSSWIAAGTNLSGQPGDITANRGGTGYVFLGNGGWYVGFDGSNYQMPGTNLYVNGGMVATESNAMGMSNKVIYDPQMMNQVQLGGGSYTLPSVSGLVGKWRFVKAWSGNMVMYLTNGTLIVFGAQYGSGQYTLRSGDSLSIYCDGSNWWVI